MTPLRLLLVALSLQLGMIAMESLAEAAERPNIIVILCDDMGFSDIGCYGGEIETPNLDRLAAGGLRFTDFHNNAKCTETRASLMTGLWHQQSKNLSKPGHVTLAEVLRSAGYSTLMSGKWHLPKNPRDRGFDHYFGFLGGAISFYTGQDWGSGQNQMRLEREVFKAPEDFYSTDAFTDYALTFIDDAIQTDQPFFLYLAHNAPHFPLHALPEDIAKYKGKYSEGWDVIRERRYAALQKLGIIDDTWRLSQRDPKVEGWDELTEKEQKFLEPMMEVYAAMVDRLDQNIGRLVAHLEKKNKLDNTLILFMSDNGACPYQRLQGNVLVPGPKESNIAYDARWANMCNTPLRLYKQYAHEGGSSTPMIAHWPAGIKARGKLTHTTSHLVDIMPTVVELSGAKYPKEMHGEKILPMEGVSLTAAFAGAETREVPIYWEYNGNHAVRSGDWKLVAERGQDWELYDLSQDRSETQNLVSAQPEQTKQLAELYDVWAQRTGARSHAVAKALKPSTQSQLFDLEKLLSKPRGK